uniref:sphinganine-1-phosphate aldolase n=1 Tax=Acrobeloides nanus TaxID=290746 RepID=A0A914CI28_9BILA
MAGKLALYKDTVVSNFWDLWDYLNGKLTRVNPVVLVVASVGGTYFLIKLRRLLRRSDRPIHKRLMGYAFSWLRCIPQVQRKIDQELSKTRKEVVDSIHKYDTERVFIKELPYDPTNTEKILQTAKKYEQMGTFGVNEGRVSGAVYTAYQAEDHLELLAEVFKSYAYSNPLHPDVFPGCRKMEAEVIRIVANLYSGPPDACGTLTTGGTESIMLACLAYRNRAQARGIEEPLMIIPVTAHAAFDKAAGLFNIRVKHIPVDKDSRVDVNAMKRAITRDTCMLVGSAPNFPTGTVDNILAISELGRKYKIPVHVDCCLGGFLVPFMMDAGFNVPVFDFQLPGVTSISCDTHKYGYAPKGSSVILYRSPEYLHHQYFSITEWPGGIYATPTLSGSRSGLTIALTWATLLHFGRNEYIERTKKIVGAAQKLAAAIPKIPGLILHGKADVSVVAFRSEQFNIYAVSDKLNKLGWNLNTLQYPDA